MKTPPLPTNWRESHIKAYQRYKWIDIHPDDLPKRIKHFRLLVDSNKLIATYVTRYSKGGVINNEELHKAYETVPIIIKTKIDTVSLYYIIETFYYPALLTKHGTARHLIEKELYAQFPLELYTNVKKYTRKLLYLETRRQMTQRDRDNAVRKTHFFQKIGKLIDNWIWENFK